MSTEEIVALVSAIGVPLIGGVVKYMHGIYKKLSQISISLTEMVGKMEVIKAQSDGAIAVLDARASNLEAQNKESVEDRTKLWVKVTDAVERLTAVEESLK